MFRAPALVLTLAAIASPAAAADGASVFNRNCRSCHLETSTPAAPTLKGVVGARIAGRSDFRYSPGLKAKTGVWDKAALDAYLTSPTKFASGSRMMFSLSDPDERAAVIEHLKTLK